MKPLASLLPALSTLPLLALIGCDILSEVVKTDVKAPKAALNRVEKTHGPTTDQTLAWTCFELMADDNLCRLAGWDSKPSDAAMLMSFDLVFDLENNNTDIPIPLIEILLGVTVMEDDNLGAICISFCDPDAGECVPSANAEGACEVDEETTDVKEPADLIPTVDDLVGLAEAVAEGDVDNGDFRWIPPGESVEGHVQFDLAVDTTYHLMETLLLDAVDDALAGRRVVLEVPYSVDGTLFFDVPELGRYAIGFGPFSDVWPIGQN